MTKPEGPRSAVPWWNPKRWWPPIRRWVWNHGPSANLIAAVALLAAVVTPILIDTYVATRDGEAASQATADHEVDFVEQQAQGDTLDGIEQLLSESSRGTNPSLPVPQAVSTSEPCRDDGERFTGAWGPERPVYTDDARPTYALINSVRDNPNIGDERSFYGIRDAASEDRGWHSSIEVEPGHTYRVRVFVRNDATNSGAVAGDARIKVNLPTCTGRTIQSAAFITSTDTFPIEIYSGIALNSERPFNIAYIEGSALIESNSESSPFAIASTDLLTTAGQRVGFDELDGELRPGYRWAVYLSFEIRPQFAQ